MENNSTVMLQNIERDRKLICPGKINYTIGLAVASLFPMIKKEILTLNTQQNVVCRTNRSSGKQFESYAQNISREIEHSFFQEGITKKSAGL